MRTWRVGTLSMGVTLLFTGFGLLYAQINEKQVLEWAAHWWPLVFILLGAEVLWQSYQAKKTNDRVSYDILSVFIIGVLLCFGLTLEALRETGVLEQCKTALVSQTYQLNNSSEAIPLDAALKTVVIEQSNDPLEIIVQPTDQIKASFRLQATASTREEALRLSNDNTNMKTRREGDTMYIAFTGTRPASHMSAGILYQRNTLYLPERVEVKIYGGVSDLKIHAANISNHWYVNGVESTSLDIPAASNLQITALTNSRDELQGNANWQVKENPPPGGTNQSEGPGRTEGKLTLGTGQHTMTFNCNGPINIDLLS